MLPRSLFLASRLDWVRRFRVGIPCAWGRHAWFPTVPRRQAIKIVVGAPIPRPVVHVGTDEGAAIAEYRRLYLAAVRDLFEAHKADAPGSARRKTLRWLPLLPRFATDAAGTDPRAKRR